MRPILAPALAALLACAAAQAEGDPWKVRLQPLDPAHGVSFGETVALGGSTLLAVGAPDAAGTGVVVVFRRDPGGWVQETVLVPTGMSNGARFGAALRFNGGWGGTLLVGAPLASPGGIPGAGEVRTFNRGSNGVWTPNWTVVSDQPVPDGHFGAAVHASGWVYIGEPDNGPGRVTVWTDPNAPMDGVIGSTAGDRFGAALAPSHFWYAASVEYHMYVGAPGARRVYALNLWHDVFTKHGFCSDPTRPGFGSRIASVEWSSGTFPNLGEHVAVGHDGAGVEVWSIDYTPSSQPLATLVPFDGSNSAAFGASFAFSRLSDATSALVVGDPAACMGGATGSGGAYRFTLDLQEIGATGGLAPYTRLAAEGTGTSVAASGTLVALGAPGAGIVQVFDWSGTLGTAWCESEPNSRGAAPVLYAMGSDELALRELGFMAVGLPVGVPALLVGSRNGTWTPLGMGQAGARCVDPPFVRFLSKVTTSDAGGRAIVRIDPLAMPGGVAAAVGETWTFQYWYMDTAAPLPTNTTHALQVTFR